MAKAPLKIRDLLPKARKPKELKTRPEPSPERVQKQAMYDYKWSLSSKLYRQLNPLCAECSRQGIATPSECVDHIVPHKGDWQLFWDETNWQAMCHRCHNKKSAKE